MEIRKKINKKIKEKRVSYLNKVESLFAEQTTHLRFSSTKLIIFSKQWRERS